MAGAIDTVEDVRAVVARLGEALQAGGRVEQAGLLAGALVPTGTDAGDLLSMRQALVLTRPVWAQVDDDELRIEASRAVAAAKRIAIDL